jgi:signal transduction histidine kinase
VVVFASKLFYTCGLSNMSLKKKLIFLLILSGVILAKLFYIAFCMIMRPSLEHQKTMFIETFKRKIDIALSIEKENIEILCANWANWESMTNYVDHPSREFEIEVFPDLIFFEDMMDLIIVDNLEQELLFSKAYKDEKFFVVDRKNIAAIISRLRLLMKIKPESIHCIINSGPGPVMIAANPITNGQKREKLIGILVLGRFIQQKMLQKISSYVMEDVRASRLDQKQLERFGTSNLKGRDLFYREKKDKLIIYYLLRDVNNEPAVMFYTEADNRTFRVIHQHIITFIIIIILSIILLGLLLYIAIRTQVIKRMLNISGTMKQIEGLEDLSKRIAKDPRNDEIALLVTNINAMLDKLEHEKINREFAEKAMITHGKLASIGRLTSCIGHEVNNPLLAIGNSIQVIKKISKSKSSLFNEAIKISESELNRIRDIISSLLDFHRLEGEEFLQTDVADIVRESLKVLKWSKKLGSTDVVQRMQKGCFVYGSPGKLKQVFVNFILNAAEALEMNSEYIDKNSGGRGGDAGGTLQIEVIDDKKEESDCVEIHFIDNGPGIPAEIKSYLFEPFVSTKMNSGVGLGLYISYKIIETHGGEVIYNEDYKQGTHFIIKLPKEKRSAGG